MRREDPPYLAVGHVDKPHGTRGEVYVWPLTDRPQRRFVEGASLHVSDPGGSQPDPALGTLALERVRPFRRGFLVKFRGVDGREAAEALRGRYLLVAFREVEPPAPDEVFYHQLLGATVVTGDGEEVGEVVEVYELRPAHLLEVRRGEGTLLVPLTRRVVRSVDAARGRIVFDPPPGLLDL